MVVAATDPETIPLCATAKESKSYFNTRRRAVFFWLFLIFYALYLTSAAAIFQALETPEEQALVNRFRSARYRFLRNYPSVSGWSINNVRQVILIML